MYQQNGTFPDARAVPGSFGNPPRMLVGKRRRVLIYQRPPHPVPYIILAFRLPGGVRYHITYGWVQGYPTNIGSFLRPGLRGCMNRFIEILPQIAGSVLKPSDRTQMGRLRQDVEDWDWDLQRVHIMLGGEVVSLVDFYLRRELMFVFVEQDCPVKIRGAYDSE